MSFATHAAPYMFNNESDDLPLFPFPFYFLSAPYYILSLAKKGKFPVH